MQIRSPQRSRPSAPHARRTIRSAGWGIRAWVCLAITVAIAQATPLGENFSIVFPPAGWSTFQSDSGNATWTRSPRFESGWGWSGYSPAENLGPSDVSRRWLVTPPLQPTIGSDLLQFYARTQFPALNAESTDDTLRLLLSHGGNTVTDFSTTLLTLKPGTGGDFASTYRHFSVDLTPFSGDVIRLAFVSSDWASADNNVYVDSVRGPEVAAAAQLPASPEPADGASGVATATTLLWTNGSWTVATDLYLSQSLSDVSTLQPTALVAAGSAFSDYDPPSNYVGGQTWYWRVVCGNGVGQSIGPVWSFSVGNGPLAGEYKLGGADGDFNSFAGAIGYLAANGIEAPSEIRVAAGTYTEQLTIPAIPGTGISSPLEITRATDADSVVIRYAGSSDSSVIRLHDCAAITLTGFDVRAEAANVVHGVLLDANCRDVVLRGMTIRGYTATNNNSDGVRIRGSDCANIQLDSLTIRRFADGVHIESGTTVLDSVSVTGCRIDSVRRGVYLARVRAGLVSGNDISVNAGSVEDVAGIQLGTMLPMDTTLISANKIHGMTTSGPFAVGIRVKPDSAAAVVRLVNNFIYGFQNTGTSQTRGVLVSSGRCELANNSILLNDVPATGSAYSVYVANLGGGTVSFLNNILANRELTASAYNLFFLNSTTGLASDHNVFQGTGANYRLARLGVDYAALTSWRVLGYDTCSAEGNPQFASDQDLHLTPLSSLAHQNGDVVPCAPRDIDGDLRSLPPDRGADEYAFSAPSHDYAVIDVPQLWGAPVVGTSVAVRAVLLNRGSAPQTAVPVRLLYQNVVVTTLPVSLAALEVDTLEFSWPTPLAPAAGYLTVRSDLPLDAEPDNDSTGIWITVVNPALNGSYRIGGIGAEYPTFSAAVADLASRGVVGPVMFDVAALTYTEAVTIPPIPGASAINAILFHRDPMEEGAALLRSAGGDPALTLNGADFVAVDGIDFEAVLPSTTSVVLTNGADRNTISGGSVRGSSQTMTTAYGLRVYGGGNDGNSFHSLAVSGAYIGVRLEGTASLADSGNVFDNGDISDCRYGLRADYQQQAAYTDNRITCGYAGATVSCAGLYIGSHTAAQVCRIERNRITGAGIVGTQYGIYSNAGTGLAEICNNFISRLTSSGGSVFAVCLRSGAAQVDHNSICLSDIPPGGDVIAIYDTSVTPAAVRNNSIRISDSDNNSYALVRAAGALVSDYNLIDGSRLSAGAPFYMGRAGATLYPSLAAWTAGTAADSHSVSGDAGFVNETDLHVLRNVATADGRGLDLSGLSLDIDLDYRQSPPDIGADEYDYVAAANDYSVQWAEPLPTIPADSVGQVVAIVRNAGTQAQLEVPVRLFFNDAPLDELVISLTPGEIDTVSLWWLTPSTDLQDGSLKVKAFLPGDAIPLNDSVAYPVTVVGPPLEGSYQVGGSVSDFANLGVAARHLTLRGVADSVLLAVAAGNYFESLLLTPIPGASAANPVVFLAADSASPPVLTNPAGQAVVELRGCSYVTLSRFDIRAGLSATEAVLLHQTATHNTLSNCLVRGPDSTNSNSIGIHFDLDRNDSNTVVACVISGTYTGIGFSGGAVAQSFGNSIRGCSITAVRYGVSLDNQVAALVEGNDIEPGFPTEMAAPCYGVFVASLDNGGSAVINANRIHGFSDHSLSVTNRAVGVYAAAAAGAAVTITNNFIYDFSDVWSLRINAIYLSSGTNLVFNNSILLDEVTPAGEIACVFISNSSTHTLQNNILVSRETGSANYAILHATGEGLQSDYNDIFGSAPAFSVARLGTQSFVTFAAWQAAAYDLHGYSREPGFISASDLHIRPDSVAVDGLGLALAALTSDIDGELRSATPDIGADEYTVAIPPDTVPYLTCDLEGGRLLLHWLSVERAASYHVYASDTIAVEPIPANEIGITVDTQFEDLNFSPLSRRFYMVTADTEPPPFRAPPPPR
ncbi:choice-of-anchor J domain-containing protein [candidate division KSB1 bacterium]|nr:choice-of-anchor J domain-containing protein [candidate division KSB1 bacterium]